MQIFNQTLANLGTLTSGTKIRRDLLMERWMNGWMEWIINDSGRQTGLAPNNIDLVKSRGSEKERELLKLHQLFIYSFIEPLSCLYVLPLASTLVALDCQPVEYYWSPRLDYLPTERSTPHWDAYQTKQVSNYSSSHLSNSSVLFLLFGMLLLFEIQIQSLSRQTSSNQPTNQPVCECNKVFKLRPW